MENKNESSDTLKIENYLHYHLGCECKTGSMDNNRTVILTIDLMHEWQGEIHRIFPILRPLSDILNTEAFEIYKMYFEKETALDFSGDTGSAYFNPKNVRVTSEHAIKIFNGQDYSTGDFMKVVSIVPYLLSKHFDLFGLIEAGLAIDKSKINKP